MADQARLSDLVEQLNAALGEVTPYKLAVVDPKEIRPVDKNAHYMPRRVYDQLRKNVEQDGNLSSLPLCWRKPNGEFVALSGNHRVMIAKDAGVPLILTLYTSRELNRAEQVAIQLSHNALAGKDNPQTLRELWDEIDRLDWKVYSGLDDELLQTTDKINVARFQEETLRFEELRILFLSSEIDQIQETLKRLGTASRRRFLARIEEFDRFFEALLDFKEAKGIFNTGTAFMALIEIAEAWNKHHDDEQSGK